MSTLWRSHKVRGQRKKLHWERERGKQVKVYILLIKYRRVLLKEARREQRRCWLMRAPSRFALSPFFPGECAGAASKSKATPLTFLICSTGSLWKLRGCSGACETRARLHFCAVCCFIPGQRTLSLNEWVCMRVLSSAEEFSGKIPARSTSECLFSS